TATASVVALSTPAFAKTETVKGKIVDVSCYNMDKANNARKDHKMPKGDTPDCATGCAKAGRPMAIITDDGKVYELTGGLAADKNAKIVPNVAHTIEVTGDLTEKDGKMKITADVLMRVSKYALRHERWWLGASCRRKGRLRRAALFICLFCIIGLVQ